MYLAYTIYPLELFVNFMKMSSFHSFLSPFIHSFIHLSNSFILFRVTVDLETISGTLVMWREYTLDELPSRGNLAQPPTGLFLDSGRKWENPEEMDREKTCKETPH